MSYPVYAKSEKIADALVHLSGLVMAITGIIIFLFLNAGDLAGAQIASLVIYWIALLSMISASLAYHATPWEDLRPQLRKLDYAMIYVKIAGTYTPIVMLLGGALAYSILALVWVLALVGAGAKLFYWQRPNKFGTVLYLALGWLSAVLVWRLFELSPAAGWCAAAGGLTYTAGVYFFYRENLKYANAIWHGFVVTASGLFFASIWIGTLA